MKQNTTASELKPRTNSSEGELPYDPSDVTIAIPAYNSERTIEQVLASVAKLRGGAKRILVVDDGSTDATARIASKYADVVSHPENLGVGHARNTAVRETDTRYIAFLDADVMPQPSWLIRLMTTLREEAEIVGVQGRIIEQTKTWADRWRQRHMNLSWGSKRRRVHFLVTCNCVYVRNAILEAGMFDASCVTSGEDVNLSRRITEMGGILMYNPRAVCYHLRCDNLRTVLETRWRYWFAYPKYKVGWLSLRKRLTRYTHYTIWFLRQDIGEEPEFILIDLLLVPWFLQLELRLWPRKWRLRSNAAQAYEIRNLLTRHPVLGQGDSERTSSRAKTSE